MTVVLATAMVLLLSSTTTDAFTTTASPISIRSSTIKSNHAMTLTDVSEFYAKYPLQSAVLTCGVKASAADAIAQVKAALAATAATTSASSEINLEVKRNVAYIIYGGIFIGLMCHMEYDYVFPMLFGTDHSIPTIVKEILFDNFISGPLLWLPPAYLIKAVIYDYPMKEGLENYFSDITDYGLLNKYWKVWVPAQTISFSIVPDHLRVAFMASVSFFWFIMFSTVSAQNDEETANGSSSTSIPAVPATTSQE